MAQHEWQREWPTELGRWWFYGWSWGGARARADKPELYLVDVGETVVLGSMVYETDGEFLYKEEGATGMWMKAQLPELPKLD